ncbi:bifunctional phosphoglucose/phosphomannose isomerase [Candidatus Thorarchaeota archaeon]|nr:MAG: bifunctional phosphoglucose/phosphomannose isomerase [Candidatus Thorarchaeota archaeon]
MDTLKLIDPKDMRNMVTFFPELLSEIALESDLKDTIIKIHENGIDGLCFIGMGGSSIAGNYVKAIFSEKATVPMIVERSYTIPKYINKDWIVVAISYSGNTEETLSSLKTAMNNNLRTICITSNGVMEKSGCQFVSLPKNFQPRAAFPLIFSALLTITELSLGENITNFKRITKILQEKTNLWGKTIPKPAHFASLFENKIPLFIGAEHLSAVAYRAKCQINENSKHLAFNSEIPEANHNEIEGFEDSGEDLIKPIFLRGNHEFSKISSRLDTTYEMYKELKLDPLDLRIDCSSTIGEMLALTHYLDMVSIELAEIKGVNPITGNRISELKRRLS